MKILFFGLLTTTILSSLGFEINCSKERSKNGVKQTIIEKIKKKDHYVGNDSGTGIEYITRTDTQILHYNPSMFYRYSGHGAYFQQLNKTYSIQNVSSSDWNTVEVTSYFDIDDYPWMNIDVWFDSTTGEINVNGIMGNQNDYYGDIEVTYKYETPRILDSDYDDIDDTLIEQAVSIGLTHDNDSDNGIKDETYFGANKAEETGIISGTIHVRDNFQTYFLGRPRIDTDWFKFTTNYRADFVFEFTAPNSTYYMSFYKHRNVDSSATATIHGKGSDTISYLYLNLYPGTYYLRLSASDSSLVNNNTKYQVTYYRQPVPNNKKPLEPRVLNNFSMALWTNDILSDVIPNRLALNNVLLEYVYQRGTSRTVTGYVDPVWDQDMLDSVLFIWDKNILKGLNVLLQEQYREIMLSLCKENLDPNEYCQYTLESTNDGIKCFLTLAGKKYTQIEDFSKLLEELTLPLDVLTTICMAIVNIVNFFVRLATPQKLEYNRDHYIVALGRFWQSLHDATKRAKDPNDHTVLVLPRFSKLEYIRTQKQIDPRNIEVKEYTYWKTYYISPELSYFQCDNDNEYTNKCISQYQSMNKHILGELNTEKITFHGKIELLSNSYDELSNIFGALF